MERGAASRLRQSCDAVAMDRSSAPAKNAIVTWCNSTVNRFLCSGGAAPEMRKTQTNASSFSPSTLPVNCRPQRRSCRVFSGENVDGFHNVLIGEYVQETIGPEAHFCKAARTSLNFRNPESSTPATACSRQRWCRSLRVEAARRRAA
jgi:hypothetical protein